MTIQLIYQIAVILTNKFICNIFITNIVHSHIFILDYKSFLISSQMTHSRGYIIWHWNLYQYIGRLMMLYGYHCPNWYPELNHYWRECKFIIFISLLLGKHHSGWTWVCLIYITYGLVNPMIFNTKGLSKLWTLYSKKVTVHENWSGREKESSPKVRLIWDSISYYT